MVSYSVVGTVTARNYFEIDSNGGIYVKISLLDSSQQVQYQVSNMICFVGIKLISLIGPARILPTTEKRNMI